VCGQEKGERGGAERGPAAQQDDSYPNSRPPYPFLPPFPHSHTAMVVKRKPSRKEKRLQKKLKRLEDELSSDEEEEQQQPQRKLSSQPSKAGKQDSARSAASARLLKAAAESDEDEDDDDDDDDSDGSSSSGGAGEEGDVSDAGGESFDEMDGLDDDDDFLGNEAAKADVATAAASGTGAKDGMADVMARILNQEVNKKAPVLAKRRTALMKDMEKEKRERHRAKEAAEKKRAALNHQLYVPDHKDAERERQLRRIATRGVVALFNAVTKARQAQEEGGDGSTGMFYFHTNHISFCRLFVCLFV